MSLFAYGSLTLEFFLFPLVFQHTGSHTYGAELVVRRDFVVEMVVGFCRSS